MSQGDLPETIRIMLIEDQVRFRHAMVSLLEREPDLEVVAQVGSIAEARSQAVSKDFDVAILDLGLPDGYGADLIAELRQLKGNVAVLIMSATLDPSNLARANESGADGLLDKLATPEEIIATIRRIAGG